MQRNNTGSSDKTHQLFADEITNPDMINTKYPIDHNKKNDVKHDDTSNQFKIICNLLSKVNNKVDTLQGKMAKMEKSMKQLTHKLDKISTQKRTNNDKKSDEEWPEIMKQIQSQQASITKLIKQQLSAQNNNATIANLSERVIQMINDPAIQNTLNTVVQQQYSTHMTPQQAPPPQFNPNMEPQQQLQNPQNQRHSFYNQQQPFYSQRQNQGINQGMQGMNLNQQQQGMRNNNNPTIQYQNQHYIQSELNQSNQTYRMNQHQSPHYSN